MFVAMFSGFWMYEKTMRSRTLIELLDEDSRTPTSEDNAPRDPSVLLRDVGLRVREYGRSATVLVATTIIAGGVLLAITLSGERDQALVAVELEDRPDFAALMVRRSGY